MTIQTPYEVQQAYDYCKDNPRAAPEEKSLAVCADAAIEEVLSAANLHGLKFPGDDRCFDIEASIFKALAEENGFDIAALAKKNEKAVA